MTGNPILKAPTLAAALLSLAAWAAAPSAMAECACMCVEGVAYEVCTGIVTTQAETAECTAQLECPTAPAAPDEGSPVEPPDETAGLDCRERQVYRPDLGEYKMHTVCMPAARTAAHDHLRAKREEMADKYDEGTGNRAGRGPHSRD